MPRHLDIALRGIGADDRRAEPRQRLGQDATAATDVEHAQSGKAVEPFRVAAEMRGGTVADVTQADRIEFMQRRHRAARIPPFPGNARKPRNFVRIDAAGRYGLAIHG